MSTRNHALRPLRRRITGHWFCAAVVLAAMNGAHAQKTTGGTALKNTTTVPNDWRRWSFRIAPLPTTQTPGDVPAHVTLPADATVTQSQSIVMQSGNVSVPGQLVRGENALELWWVVPASLSLPGSVWITKTAPQSTLNAPDANAKQPGFTFRDEPGQWLDVLLDGRPVARYMYAHDTSTPVRTTDTFKPYWHVYDAQGKNFITKGPGGLFPHHRGLFIGWNKISDISPSATSATATKKPTWDLWHMTQKASMVHEKFLVQEAGPVLARVASLVSWNDGTGKALLKEERTVTIFRTATNLMLLDWKSKLSSERDAIQLDGDPEHSGVQFRPSDDVGKNLKPGEIAAADAKRVSATYVFPREKVDAHKDLDLPWAAVQFELYGQPYNVLHLNAPDNPKNTLYSAYRDYGRFGAFAKSVVTRDKPLTVHYGIAVTDGPLPQREVLAARYGAFSQPPQVEIVK